MGVLVAAAGSIAGGLAAQALGAGKGKAEPDILSMVPQVSDSWAQAQYQKAPKEQEAMYREGLKYFEGMIQEAQQNINLGYLQAQNTLIPMSDQATKALAELSRMVGIDPTSATAQHVSLATAQGDTGMAVNFSPKVRELMIKAEKERDPAMRSKLQTEIDAAFAQQNTDSATAIGSMKQVADDWKEKNLSDAALGGLAEQGLSTMAQIYTMTSNGAHNGQLRIAASLYPGGQNQQFSASSPQVQAWQEPMLEFAQYLRDGGTLEKLNKIVSGVVYGANPNPDDVLLLKTLGFTPPDWSGWGNINTTGSWEPPPWLKQSWTNTPEGQLEQESELAWVPQPDGTKKISALEINPQFGIFKELNKRAEEYGGKLNEIKSAEDLAKATYDANEKLLGVYKGDYTAEYDAGYTGTKVIEKLKDTPGYQFQFDQGTKAIERQGAAAGMLGSGNTLTGLTQYGQGLAQNFYQVNLGNLANIVAMGSGAISQTAANFIGQAQDTSSLKTQQGTVGYSTYADIGDKRAESLYHQGDVNVQVQEFNANLKMQALLAKFNKGAAIQQAALSAVPGMMYAQNRANEFAYSVAQNQQAGAQFYQPATYQSVQPTFYAPDARTYGINV